jgi:hypothetical protein
MFVIRDAVWDRLAEHARADFIARMRVHLRRFFPSQCNALGERLEQFVEIGIARARQHGFEAEREVCKYIDLMCAFGHRFHAQPWAREILEDRFQPDPEERMRRLLDAGIEVSQKTGGQPMATVTR